MTEIDHEKGTQPRDDPKNSSAVTIDKEHGYISDTSSSTDGDDALKLAGTEAHHFDEEYYKRLRWKIVRPAHNTTSSFDARD